MCGQTYVTSNDSCKLLFHSKAPNLKFIFFHIGEIGMTKVCLFDIKDLKSKTLIFTQMFSYNYNSIKLYRNFCKFDSNSNV